MERILKWNDKFIQIISNKIFYVSAVGLLTVNAIIRLPFAAEDFGMKEGSYFELITRVQAGEWFLLVIFPLAPLLSYVHNRRKGYSNPAWNALLIGFCWSGLVSVYPALLFGLLNHLNYDPGWNMGLIFLRNFIIMGGVTYLFLSSRFIQRVQF